MDSSSTISYDPGFESNSSCEYIDSDDGSRHTTVQGKNKTSIYTVEKSKALSKGISMPVMNEEKMQKVEKGRKNIRVIKKVEDLSIETRVANIEEEERIKRVENLKKKFEIAVSNEKFKDQLILDFDFENNIPLVSVHKSLASKLKSHQKDGVKFMWDSCYESLEHIGKSKGSGCILAHCMGLGKTLQVITLIHTLLSYEKIGTHTVLICCPKNTLLNWANEFTMWISPDMGSINVYNPTRSDTHEGRLLDLKNWKENGGVCIINYELFRILVEDGTKHTKQFPLKYKEKYQQYLLNPGPDLIVCDEGHVLKNDETRLSVVMNKIRTLRRIILTGTPLQNNLKEYYCMVQFVKPHLLGSRNEFLNMFVNPILNGQYENSLIKDVRFMKERSHILHKKLSGCVQRFDLSILKQFLPKKQEYVILISLTDCQVDLYRFFMANYCARGDPRWKNSTTALFADYQALQRIWTHPYTFKIFEDKQADLLEQPKAKSKKRKKKKPTADEDFEETSDSEYYNWRRYPLSWWSQFVSIDDVEDCRLGNKMLILLKILKECEEAGEKMLLFSGSLFSLNMIEHFLKRINRSEFENPALCNMTSTWEEGEDYLILTGQTSAKDRDTFCKRFNNINDLRLRLFLISTKAGGMGINLVAANRAVLFDASWNPSHDTQSIFRIYRIGQKKPCFIYRFVACGTMEEKIYERQVAKQSISHRVVDELQTARHFTETELLALYKFEPYKRHKINAEEIQDPFLKNILNDLPNIISGILEHDSLLEHKEEEELHDLEKSNAWTSYNHNECGRLPEEVKSMLAKLTPEDFDPHCFKKVLERKFPKASKARINQMMEDLMPRIKCILERPDFIDVMTRQALLAHNGLRGQKDKRQKRKKEKLKKARISSQNESVVELKDQKENNPIIISSSSDSEIEIIHSRTKSSDSDDTIFLYECRGRKRKKLKKPINYWGVRNGKFYGTLDTSSEY